MIRCLVLVILLFQFTASHTQEYFQQEVDYDIKVKLVDSIHTLEGEIEIQYKNNAPIALDTIYMHLWGNAFKNRSTAFAKQKLRNFKTEFYFAEPDQYGYYADLDFRISNKSVRWDYDEEHVDIAYLLLNEPLQPGQSISITTPFTLRIPASFSRLGHVETSYQLTQWYPKPAVYDREGWHAMPYLDMGEFYSEFGDFKVEITLPENYYVGATGELQTASERKRIEDRIAYTTEYLKDSLSNHLEFPPSSPQMKTLRYEAESVHDFALFIDKRFLIQKDIAELPSGKKVDCWAFFTDFEKELWKDADFYVKRSVEFYSERVGEYPYPHATAIQSALSAGGGMEYPMITVIGESGYPASLDQVITHEVGHNWFYGILASNERDYPWMDEGMNSYHDHKYTDIYYEDYDEFVGLMPAKIKKQMEYSALEYVYQIWARIAKDQAPNTHSNELTSVNYFLGAYEKPAIAFRLLEKYIGEEEFIGAMKEYYNEWQFKHPQPEDTKASFEKSTGLDLSWLFEGMLFSNAVYDYKIIAIDRSRNELTVRNNGTVAAPFDISYSSDSTASATIWYDGFLGEKIFPIEVSNFKYAEIDKERISLDIQPSNNDYKANGSAVGPKPQIRLVSGLKTSKTSKVFLLPYMGYNRSNLFQVGLVFHNYSAPLSNFQYYLNPTLGLRKGQLIGSFEFRRDFPRRSGLLKNISIALGGKSFHELYNERFDYNLRFTKIQPSIEWMWKKKMISPESHFVTYRPIGIVNEFAIFSRENGYEGKGQNLSVIHELSYRFIRRSPITPLQLEMDAEYRNYDKNGNSNSYLKISANADAKYAYKENKFFNIRLFGGFFPFHSERSISTTAALGNFSMFHRGINDYKYDYNFYDRRGQDGFLSRQVTMEDGGFKNGLTNSMPIGLSNNYLIAANLSIDLPFAWTRLIPVKPYFDAGVYSFKATTSDPFKQEVLYSGGLMLDFRKTVMIHFPLFNAAPIENVYAQTADNYWQRISFTIDLNKLNPHLLKYWFYR